MKFLKTAVVACATAFSAFSPGISAAQDLVISIGSRGYGQAVVPGIETFKAANPGINVEWLKISDVPNESRKLYVTSFLAKSPTPDVFAVDIIWPGEFAKRGWIAPLSDDFDAKDAAAYNSAFVEAATVDGKVYGVPLFVGGTMFFYRKDLLDKYGLGVPNTWEEVIASAKTVLEGENDPQLTGFVSMWAKIEGLFMNWLSFVYGNGGSFFDSDGNLAVNSPNAIEATQTMVDFLYKHKIAKDSILNMRPDDARTLFQQGRAVFLMVQDFVYAPLSAPDSPVADKFDFKRNPYFAAHPGAPSTAMGGYLLAVNANSKHMDAAIKLAKHMGSYDHQLWAATNASKSPGRMDVYGDTAMQGNDVLLKFGDAYGAGVVRPSAQTGNLYPKVTDVMQLEITNALHRKKTVEQALNDATAAINKILGK